MAYRPDVPLIATVDVIVAGGASGGVAAACAAAAAGKRVFLAAPETYLGEDICATGRLWQSADAPLDTDLARKLLADAAGAPLPVARPLDVKRALDTALIDAGVAFLFGCHPADLLLDSQGRLAGVVFASKAGPFAVAGRQVIDATPFAALAAAAGVPFTPWTGGEIAFRRVVLGHRAEGDSGAIGRKLPAPVPGETDGKAEALDAFEYEVRLPVAAWTPAALADAEQTLRDRTWHKDQTWMSDRASFTPPVSVAAAAVRGDLSDPATFATPTAGLHVLGPCAAVPRAEAARLQLAPVAIAAGERLGRHAADEAARLPAPAPAELRPAHVQPSTAGLREPCTCARFLREATGRIAGHAGAALPSLGNFDVVVVGGGTGGAPAAIAAARAGARVLAIESLAGLGGVGTLGYISYYYHGYREGFIAEVTEALRRLADNPAFQADGWNPEHKVEWFRRELRKAGGAVWFGSVVSGARTTGRRVDGVIVNTPWGRGWVGAGAVIDATGNADVAAAAGAECGTVSDRDLAVQGSGLPSRPFRPTYRNTDYTFIEDGDPSDTTRAFVVARRKFAKEFDLAQICDTRERRQIAGDVTVTPLDAYTGRTWRDTICLSRSNFDSHGFTVHPIFFVLPPDRVSLDAWLPLRALLPKGLDGLLVTGLALSGQRDVMPVLRMQPDIQNHAYAAGLAAAAAARAGGDVRGLDVRALQRQLVARGILPGSVLLHEDRRRLADGVVESAAAGGLDNHAEIAALLSRPDAAAPLLRRRLAKETDAAARLACAKILAMTGDAAGADVLAATVREAPAWDAGWNYTGMGQFGRSLSPLDDAIVALAAIRADGARDAVLDKARSLDAAQAFSHFRAVALYAEALGGADLAAALADVLGKPGIAGHAWTTLAAELADIPESRVDTRTRNEALRELYLARALLRGGDRDGLAARLLGAYARDIRGHFARHAAAVLRAP
jgi:ribulose 1,5-bisphosphate synthetase/thiazole synthase